VSGIFIVFRGPSDGMYVCGLRVGALSGCSLSHVQLQMEVGEVSAEDDQVFLMAQQALMVKSPRSASTTVRPHTCLCTREFASWLSCEI
jgi:hypothetical protein